MQNHLPDNNKDLLNDLNELDTLTLATKGQRFAIALIDGFLMFICYLMGLLITVNQFPQVYDWFMEYDKLRLIQIATYLFTIILYYTILEAFNKGRTVGNLLTGTHVVKNDGSKLTLKDVLHRSMYRLVGRSALAAFAADEDVIPKRDRVTNTSVVKKK
jgi:uncharacterized RDD family membrane protein YckC